MPGQGPCYYGTWAAHGPHMDLDDLGVSACGPPLTYTYTYTMGPMGPMGPWAQGP